MVASAERSVSRYRGGTVSILDQQAGAKTEADLKRDKLLTGEMKYSKQSAISSVPSAFRGIATRARRTPRYSSVLASVPASARAALLHERSIVALAPPNAKMGGWDRGLPRVGGDT
jgi:hypothetical protein